MSSFSIRMNVLSLADMTETDVRGRSREADDVGVRRKKWAGSMRPTHFLCAVAT